MLYSIPGPLGHQCGPAWALVMDAAGNLYDTTQCDGANQLGNVFKLTKTGGSWTYTSLHDFTGVNDDGEYPISGVTLDSERQSLRHHELRRHQRARCRLEDHAIGGVS